MDPMMYNMLCNEFVSELLPRLTFPSVNGSKDRISESFASIKDEYEFKHMIANFTEYHNDFSLNELEKIMNKKQEEFRYRNYCNSLVRACYELEIEKGDIGAMYRLGLHYEKIDKNYNKMKECYNMVAEQKSDNEDDVNYKILALFRLGMYYEKIGMSEANEYYVKCIGASTNEDQNPYINKAIYKLGYNYEIQLRCMYDGEGYKIEYVSETELESIYDLMKKYYDMGATRGCTLCMNRLGMFYSDTKEYDLMMEYYLMAIHHGSQDALNNLGFYYKTVEHNIDLGKEYYVKALNRGNISAKKNLYRYYKSNKYSSDFSFLELYNITVFRHSATKLINLRFMNITTRKLLDKDIRTFASLNFDDNNEICKDVRNKHFILTRTNMFPYNYCRKNMPQFVTLTIIADKYMCVLNKDVIMSIAKCLFI